METAWESRSPPVNKQNPSVLRKGFASQVENGPVAQLDRAPDFESVGRVFESRRGHHKTKPSGKIRKAFLAVDDTGMKLV